MPSTRKSQALAVPSSFTGFPEAGFRFLAQLKKHNNREWFNEHKRQYREHVEEPMEALVSTVAAKCRAGGLPLYAKEKNPVMRVYRDIRFSRDKTPYKTHVAAELRRSFSGSSVMLYIHLSPEESFAAAGVWQPDRPLLLSWREAIAQHSGLFESALAALKRSGLELSQQYSLSSMPRGFGNYADSPLAVWLKLTSFVVSRPLTENECTGADLADQVVSFAMAARPLLEFGWQREQVKPADSSLFTA